MSKDYSVLERLGEKKIFILEERISRFIRTFSQIKNIEVKNSIGLDELDKYVIDGKSFQELIEMSNMATSAFKGTVGGSLAGGITAFAAYAAVGKFAAAGTGAAIAGLSGAAAKSATLAWLGGGTLAAGGAGVAGGMMVLGGAIAAPALAVAGIYLDAKAKKHLEEAHSRLAEARRYSEEYQSGASVCRGITARAHMFINLLDRLDALFLPLIREMEAVVEDSGDDYGSYSQEEQSIVAMAMSLAGAIQSVLDTPIITTKGGVTAESLSVGQNIQNYLNTAATAASETQDSGDIQYDDIKRKMTKQGKAAEQRDTKFWLESGIAYERAGDYSKAAKWYRRAAAHGNAIAQYRLGLLYYIGRGVRTNKGEAEKWFRKAAEQGDEQAKEFLKHKAFED